MLQQTMSIIRNMITRYLIFLFLVITYISVYSQERNFFPMIKDSVVECDCYSTDKNNKPILFHRDYYKIDDTATMINGKPYYKFFFLADEGIRLIKIPFAGYLRYENDKIFFLNYNYSDTSYCSEDGLMKKSTKMISGINGFGNFCAEEILFLCSKYGVSSPYYVFYVGPSSGDIDSYFFQLDKRKVNGINEILYYFTLNKSGINLAYKLYAEYKKMIVSSQFGITYWELYNEEYGKIKCKTKHYISENN